jgi:glucose/arabinose dehydrogenase
MSTGRRILRVGVVVASLLAAVGLPPVARPAAATVLPSGFQEQIVLAGLNHPTNVEFSPDRRVFVAEKAGRIKVFDDVTDTTATLFADLSDQVFGVYDRGLLGLALAPTFPVDPRVFVLYTRDAPPGQAAPYWHDNCDPVGGHSSGRCLVTGRLSWLQASGDHMVGEEHVLVDDWCQQFGSHSIGDLRFGPGGALYVTGGDGASFSATDYGQLGDPINPCGDPPGGAMSAPSAEGGALRSQDVRTPADPAGLDGALLRLDPDTGAALPDNPLAAAADPNARRVVAYGLRNPFRFTVRPGTSEVWIGNVGWNLAEDIERVSNPTAGPVNFGWPCYEGTARTSYEPVGLTLCQSLYSGPGQTAPYFTYRHTSTVVGCASGSSALAGLAFYPAAGPYPATYRGALFFADYARGCIWAMKPATAGGLPSPSSIELFASGAASPVDLAVDPAGNELYYVDINGGTVRRFRSYSGNQPPTAALTATPTAGPAPLTVSFSALGSTDPDPADQGQLRYEWDFTNDGTVDATGVTASHTYSTAGTFTAKLTVRDSMQAQDAETVTLFAGNTAPTAVIDTPLATSTWASGATVSFSGHGVDAKDGVLPASALHWALRLQHCSSATDCHTHFLQEWDGVSAGSFIPPDHEYPAYLELVLTATDSEGLSHTVVRRLDPKTVNLSFASFPAGLQLTVGPQTQTTPFTRTFIQGSTLSMAAPAWQTSGSTTYAFRRWSDGGAAAHVMVAPATPGTVAARYACADPFGNTCQTGAVTYRPADQTVLPLTGDNAVQSVTLPFPVRFYGQLYSTAWVDTNGVLSFAPPAAPASSPGAIPSPATVNQANLAIYPFWDDLVVDSSASVRTAATDEEFVVEWRNVRFAADAGKRVSFEIRINRRSWITLAYRDIDPNALEQGGTATIGIENADGTVALVYSYRQTRLRSGTGVIFLPPGAGPVPRLALPTSPQPPPPRR